LERGQELKEEHRKNMVVIEAITELYLAEEFREEKREQMKKIEKEEQDELTKLRLHNLDVETQALPRFFYFHDG